MCWVVQSNLTLYHFGAALLLVHATLQLQAQMLFVACRWSVVKKCISAGCLEVTTLSIMEGGGVTLSSVRIFSQNSWITAVLQMAVRGLELLWVAWFCLSLNVLDSWSLEASSNKMNRKTDKETSRAFSVWRRETCKTQTQRSQHLCNFEPATPWWLDAEIAMVHCLVASIQIPHDKLSSLGIPALASHLDSDYFRPECGKEM